MVHRVFFVIIFIFTPGILICFYNNEVLNTDNVFAQGANNASTIVVPSQTGKMEITLRNSSSDKPDNSLYIALLSATAAIVGGYLAARYSHKQAMAVEALRYDEEKKKQAKMEAKQEQQNEEYREKYRAIAYSEVFVFSESLANVLRIIGGTQASASDTMNSLSSFLETEQTQFMKIPFDLRLTIFPIEVLVTVHGAYYAWEVFGRSFFRIMKEYESGNVKDWKEAVKNIKPDKVKKVADEALELMKEFLPESMKG